MLKLFEKFSVPFPDERLETPPSDLLAFCLYYTKGLGWPLFFMSLSTAVLAILEVSLFGFVGQLVDWLATHDRATFFQDEKARLIGMSVVILVLMPILTFIHSAIVHQSLLGNFPMSIRWLSHRYLLRQSVSFYHDDFAGRIATKVMQTALSIRETVMKLLDVIMYVSIYFIAILVLMVQADFRLAIPMLCWLCAYIGLQFYFVPKLKRVSTDQADARSTMTGRIVDSYTNIATVKLFSHTDTEAKYARSSMEVFLNTVYAQMRLVTGINVGVQCLNYCLAFTITAISIVLWQAEAITVGAIAVAISLALRLNGMSQWIMWEVSALFENIGAVADGAKTLARPLQLLDQPNAAALKVTEGSIELKDVYFSYDAQNTIFQGLNLSVKPGEKIGIVGRSGAGKSTLVNLLLRFYDIEKGSILIDGQSIHATTQDSVREHIGMVTQNTSLLHRSVRENILYGKPEATEDEIIEATQQAKAHEFILGLTDPKGRTGYDAYVGEQGVKLSGGQRQRIAIARVLLKNAPVLILDEATSALDSEVESAIQQNLYQLMSGKTVFAIAHRLSTIAALDRLIVIDEGKIIEQGSHLELLTQKGLYAQLWEHQSGGFLGIQ